MNPIQNLLEEGITAARYGDETRARLCLNRVLESDATYAQQAAAHFWLAKVAADGGEKHSHLEMTVTLDPQNVQARQMLAVLDGKLKPEDIVNADTFNQPEVSQPLHARRFVCPQCGGRMHHASEANRLACDYCGYRVPVLRALKSGMNIEEQDFTIGLATAGGHTKSVAARTLRCQGCQAELVSRQQHSLTCPYCGSHHVMNTQSQSLAAPQVMISFVISQQDALRSLQIWVEESVIGARYQTGDVRDIYLPAWTFDIISETPWRVMHPDQAPVAGVNPAVRTYEGRESAFQDDILVPASHLLPFTLLAAFEGFDLAALTPYDDACLAGCPAALHTITLADASLVARQKAYRTAEQHPPKAQSGDKEVAPSKVSVLSYKLVLLPFWIGGYTYKNTHYTVVINGQNGKVHGETPSGFLERTLSRVL